MLGKVLVALALCFTTAAHAADEETKVPRFRLYYESLLGVRYNPLGLQENVGLYGRVRLYDSDSILFKDAYAQLGPAVTVTPAFVQPGVHAQVSPIKILRLGARLDFVQYFGTFEQAILWDEPQPDWSDSAIDILAADGRNAPISGHLWTLDARLQALVGPIGARYTMTARGMFLDTDDPNAVGFYDQTVDAYAPVRGWTLVHDTDLLFAPPDKPYVMGVRWTMTDALLEGGHPTMHRVGPVLAWKFPANAGARFANPALLLITQFHARHPFRSGQDVSPAIPYLALAFSFNGDLIPW